MFGLSKHHFFLALVMTPFLAYVGYALTDWYLQRQQEETHIKMMQPVEPNCRLSQMKPAAQSAQPAECQFYAGDFTLTVAVNGQTMTFKGNQRLKALMVEAVGLLPPTQAQRLDEAGYVWQLNLPKKPSPEGLTLHWVAKGHWGNYLGEYPPSHAVNPSPQIAPSVRYGS